jgi:SSS family solute:Na+ symporter
LKKDAEDRHYLVVGRFVTGIILVLAVISAPFSKNFPGLYVYVQTINSFIQGPIFAVLILGILFKKITPAGGLIGLISGIFMSGIMYFNKEVLFTIEEPFLYISGGSFLGSLIVIILVSIFTKPKSVENLRGLVYGLVLEDSAVQKVLKDKLVEKE